MKPVLALVGRPNVGKSTLFNRLTKSRDAIVADYAGLTRDRHYGNGRQGKHDYIVIDTGGFEPDATTGIYREMAKQTRQAVAEADVVLFVVDARAGVSAQDHDIAKYLRRLSKPCLLVANKAEAVREGMPLVEFFELGLGDVHPVSAAHGQGIRALVELALAPLHLPELLLRFHAFWLCHRSAPILGREVPRRFPGRSMRLLERRRRRSGLNLLQSQVIGSWKLACCLLRLPCTVERHGPEWTTKLSQSTHTAP